MGVYNATIRNSTLGHMGINAIGSGTLLIENTKVYGRSLVNFRQDYGSTWDGELMIKNCVFAPKEVILSVLQFLTEEIQENMILVTPARCLKILLLIIYFLMTLILMKKKIVGYFFKF